MHCLSVCISFTLLLYLGNVETLSNKYITLSLKPSSRKHDLPSVKAGATPILSSLRAEGYFWTFLRLLLNTLIDFPNAENKDFQRLKTYTKILSDCLYELNDKYTKKLARTLKKLSRKSENRIKETLEQYREEVEDKLPDRVKFLKAMNSIFRREDNFVFHDYIRNLSKFGKTDVPLIKRETRKLLYYGILRKIRNLNSKDRRKLKKLLKKSIKEYKYGYSSYEYYYDYDYYQLRDKGKSDHSFEKNDSKLLRPEGIFLNFLKLLFNTLIDFPSADDKDFQRIRTYIRILLDHLNELSYICTRKLVKELEELFQKREDEIKESLKRYREELEDKLPRRSDFFNAMNSVFDEQDNLHFHDYIDKLKNYGSADTTLISAETKKLLNNVIFQKIRDLSSSEQRKLEEKLRNAVKEYKGKDEDSSGEYSDEIHDWSTSDNSFEKTMKLKAKGVRIVNDPKVREYF